MKKLPIVAMSLLMAGSVLPLAGTAAAATAHHPSTSDSVKAVVKPSKPLPAPKKESVPVTVEEDFYWVPGDWYWDEDDWAWADGYWLEQPFDHAIWVPGHWTERWWGETWVPGYWF